MTNSSAPITQREAEPAADFAAAHAEWHRQVEAARTSPHGPLSITGLFWVGAEPSEFEGVPGTWSADPETGAVTVRIPEGVEFARDGAPLTGTVTFEPLSGIEGFLIEWGEKRIDVAARSGRIALRPRDPETSDRLNYGGTNTFPPSQEWVVRARFVPAERADVEVGSVVGTWAKQHYDSPGIAEFELAGEQIALTLFGDADAPKLSALFADATGVDLTYPATRSVGVTRIDTDTVEIDFNRTSNLVCAYSASATCPLPPAENRLSVRVEAGELRPGVVLPA